MQTYVLRRIFLTIPVMLGVSLAVFSMLHLLPVDPVMMLIMDSTSGTAPTASVTEEQIENLRVQLGLDQPLPVQFGKFVWNALQGDLGRSFRSNRAITDLLLEQLPFTVRLALAGMGTALVLGLTLGIIAGLRPNSWIDNFSMWLATLGISMPSFWLGLMLIFVFAVQLGWLPALGVGSRQAMILPAFTLGFQASAIIARLTRSSLMEIMKTEYITTARAKGLTEWAVVLRHAFRNALIPVVTIVGLQFGNLMSGAVVIETVFGRPGIGRLGVQAILEQDFPLVQGFVLFVAVTYVLSNLLIDLCYAAIDPRIRYEN